EKFSFPVVNSLRITDAYKVAPPVVVDRLTSLQRGDYVDKSGKDHFVARLALARLRQPDFIWTPYPDFISPLQQNTTGIAGNWQRSWSPRLTSELKVSYSDDNVWWDRAHPEIPTLASGDGTVLPGSPLLYAYRNHNRSLEVIDSNVLTRNRHIITWGGGFVLRMNDGYLTAGRDSEYIFSGILSFANDAPYQFSSAVDRTLSTPVPPPFDRQYRYNNSFVFGQDSFKVSKRLTLNFGLRYERFAAPSNTGVAKDALLVPGAVQTFEQRLETATLVTGGAGNQQIFGTDNGDWAPRAGFSWDPFGKSNTIVRGGFGMFYDRPFDNLWQNVRANRYQIPIYSLDEVATPYLEPAASAIKKYTPYTNDFPGLTLIDPKLKNGYARSSFLGVQQLIRDNLTIEVNFTSSQSRRLITTDVVNRQFTNLVGIGRPLPDFPNVSWRSGQGEGDYYAVGTLVRYRSRTLQLQGAYTLSHSIDNQSDPLNGDFFDLNFTSIGSAGANTLRAAFAQQYDAGGDRGNSSFDQRHNFFAMGVWSPTSRYRVARGWKMAFMSAFRTGTPYTVLATSTIPDGGGGVIFNQRADLLDPTKAVFTTPKPATGGVYVLDPAAFRQPDSGPGTSGRNAFRGPGLYNADVSLSKTFAIPQFWKLRENATFTFRADAFNVLNHANLGNPDNLLGSKTFGLSTYGRQGAASGFPAVSPLNDAARTFQILLRAQF
ncbi:MAG TPA: TonB-dependent receptor, partial [Bryobacteraceae bacterium]|nr:TonB-dependent receptor [Bryobacteraceae bacterium]